MPVWSGRRCRSGIEVGVAGGSDFRRLRIGCPFRCVRSRGVPSGIGAWVCSGGRRSVKAKSFRPPSAAGFISFAGPKETNQRKWPSPQRHKPSTDGPTGFFDRAFMPWRKTARILARRPPGLHASRLQNRFQKQNLRLQQNVIPSEARDLLSRVTLGQQARSLASLGMTGFRRLDAFWNLRTPVLSPDP